MGSWLVDAFGLPAFRYDVDEQSDPRAQQPELAGGTGAQHQLGNDHIVAAAFELRVRRPHSVDATSSTTWVDGQMAGHAAAEGFVIFSLTGTAGSPADWAVTW